MTTVVVARIRKLIHRMVLDLGAASRTAPGHTNDQPFECGNAERGLRRSAIALRARSIVTTMRSRLKRSRSNNSSARASPSSRLSDFLGATAETGV